MRKQRIKENGFIIIMLVLLVGTIIGGYFLYQYDEEQKRESARIDKETAFQVEGVITGIKTSFTRGKRGLFRIQTTDKTKYVSVNNQEFKISDYLLGEINKGDHVKVSGKRGEIEELEVSH